MYIYIVFLAIARIVQNIYIATLKYVYLHITQYNSKLNKKMTHSYVDSPPIRINKN